MDTLDNDYSLQEETKQMKTLQMYQKLVLYTAYKYKISIILIFLSIIILGCVGRYFQFKRSSHKFEGHVTLFYTPRASEEVKEAFPNIKLIVLEPFVLLGAGSELRYEWFRKEVEISPSSSEPRRRRRRPERRQRSCRSPSRSPSWQARRWWRSPDKPPKRA